MAELTQYRVRAVPEVGLCLVCEQAAVLVKDHCHKHGWIRGLICASCNGCLGFLDRGKRAGNPALHAAFVEHIARCPDCPAWSSEWTGLPSGELEARVHLRFRWQIYIALKAAADERNQSVPALIRDITTDWLKEKGALK